MTIVLPLILATSVTLTPFAEPQLKRLSDAPILTPRAGKFDEAGAYNPAAIQQTQSLAPNKVFYQIATATGTLAKQYILLYRAQNKAGTSLIGKAVSSDGIHFTQSDTPVLSPQTDYEIDGGIEDPRLQKIGDTFYLTYTGYNKKDAQLCLATSPDLTHWKRQGVIMPAYKGTWNKQWTKSGAIVPQKINGKYWMYYLGTANGADQMGVASSTDLLHWKDATKTPVLAKRAGQFDSRVVEPGPAPIITKDGILLIYNGADDKLVYRTGWVLFDKKDPTKVLARSDKPIFEPQKEWELKGQVPNVVFVEGMIQESHRLLLYYGAADTVTGVAEGHLK